jgi:hypothetical protein
MPRQDDGWIDITTGQPSGQPTGQPTPVQPVDSGGYKPIVPSSGDVSVPRVQPAAAAKDDTVTPADVQDVIQTQYQRIVDDPSVSPERKQGLIEQLSTIAGGGTLPGLGLTGKVLGVAGKGIMEGLGWLPVGARAIQAGLAEPLEALGMIGSGAALDVSGAYGAAAGRGPIPESEASVDVTPVPSGGRDVFRLPSERISTRRSWQEKVKDPNYMLTVPNIRDKVNKPTGVGWVDKLINGGLFIVDAGAELTFQGVTDPLSYVTFGAGQWAGQAGRAALTARLLQDDAVRAVPSLLENPQRLYRLGEWGLKRSERQALVQAGILEPEGIAWAWGSQGVLGGTGRAARAVGGTVARGRASVGDVLAKIGPRGKGGIPALATVGTRRNLIAAARNRGWNDAGGEARTAVLQYAGSLAARREAGVTTAVLTSRYRGLLRELAESPFRNDIATLIEPGTTATTRQLPAEAQDLANRVTDAFEEMRQLYNMRMDGFRTKYGLNPDYAIDIPSIDNYFFHKVTPEMNRLIRTTKGTDKAPWMSQVQEMIGVGAREMRQGGGPLRMRKLIAGEKFLGVELKTGSIAEINEIWRDKTKLGFDFFETDSAEVVSSYIDSISNQAARVSYFDRLFDYGTDAIRPVLEKVIPDQALLGQAQSTLNKLNGQRQSLIRSITNAVVRGEKKAGNKLVEVAEAVLRGADDDWAKAEKAVAARQQELSNLAGQLKVLRAEADTKTANIRGAWEDMIVALELRVASIEDAISRGEGAQEAARQYLLEQHSKMFPNRKKRPSDIRQLAAEVLERRENKFASKLKALETRRSRAQRRQASAERRAERLGVEAREITESVESINTRTTRLRALSEINFDSEVAPDGVVYTSEQYLQDLPEGGAAVFYPEASDIPDPIAIPAADIEQTYDLSSRLDDMQRVLTALDESAGEVIAELTGNQEYADWITVEVRRLMESPLGTEIDPRVPEQLAPLIQTIHGWGRSAETSDEIVQTYLAAMADAVDIALADATEPIDPDSVIAIVDDMIRGAASIDAGPEAARVMVSIPDVQLGGTKILMDPTETWNIYSGATDNVFAGIADGTLAWDDVVPQRTVIEPTAAAAPTPAPSAAPAVRQTFEATTDATTVRALDRNVWTSTKKGSEAVRRFVAEAKQAERDGTINEFLDRLDDITDIGEKAELVKRALASRKGSGRGPFFTEVLDRFQMEVEFAIGRAAAGVGADNFSRNVQQAANADPELFLRYTAEAAEAAGVKKPESWAKIPKAERDQLDAAIGQPTAAAAPEPVAAVEPTTQVTSTPLDAEMRLAEEREQLIARGQQIDPELEKAARADTEARAAAAAAGREIGTLRSGETRARQAIERRVDVARGRERVDIGTGEPVTRGKAGQELRAEQRKLNKARSDMEREIQSDPVFKSIKQTERRVESAATRFEAAEAAFVSQDDWQQSVRPLYEKEINDIRDALNSAPPAGAARQGATEWANRVQGVLDNLQTVQFTDKQRQAWDRVFTQLFGLESDLAKLEANIVIQQNVVNNIANSNIGGQVVKDILDGWVEIERLGVQIPRELYDEMTLGVRKLQDPKEWNAFMKSYLEYQRFFKAYAISTPGFIVRNAMTAAFNNLVAGITPLQQAKTFKFAREYYRNGLDSAFDSLSAADRPIFEEAYRAVVGSGGGQAIDEVMPLIRGKSSRIYNNAYTRWFQKRNEQAEIWGRMAMAIDGVERGFTLDQNSARIIRYHFDYSDTSRLDEVAKLVIPFWTFASRNMSLQIINQFARPGMYQRYNDLRELTEGRASDYPLWPVWLREREPLQLGDGRYVNPDLPQIDLQQQLEQLLVPQRLLGQSNPLIRTAVEGLTQKSLAFDTPFGTKTQKAGVTDIPSIALTELFGLTGGDVSGEFTDDGYQIGRFAQSVGPGLLPPLQQLQRYLKSGLGAAGQGPESPAQQAIGGSQRYAERNFWTTLGTYLGIPYGELTPEQIQGELRRMQYAARDVGR